MLRTLRRTLLRTLPVVALATLGACSNDGTGPVTTDGDGTLTVDASTSWTYVDLGAPAQVVTVASPTTASNWDIAFNATSVMLNGGSAGPGGVTGYCICQNQAASDAQLATFTPASELADFTAVGATAIPADANAFVSDELSAAIANWYVYNPTTHAITPATGTTYLVRAANGTSFAKVRVTGIDGAAQQHAGRVTFEYALQPAAGAALGATQSATVDLGAGAPVYFSFANGVVASGAEWDLQFTGWDIRVNGGVSGSGKGGAASLATPFASVTNPGEAPASVYRADGYGGIFAQKRWYRYNITGTDNQIWPTYDVYLVKRGTEVYKIQIVNYYSASGDPRHITFRYEKVSG